MMSLKRLFLKYALFLTINALFFTQCQKQAEPSVTQLDISKTRATADSLRLEGNDVLLTDYLTARQYFQKALDMCLPLLPKSDTLVLRLFHNIGVSYFNADKYLLALAYFDSVRVNQPQEPIMWLQVHNDTKIGRCYLKLGDVDLAKLYFQNAKQFAPLYPQTRSLLPYILLEYAECLRHEKKFPEAIVVSQQAIDSSFMFPDRTVEDSLTYAHSLFAMSNILAETSNFQGAMLYSKKAISIYKAVHSDYDIARATINLSDYYRLTHQYKESEKGIAEALSMMNHSEEDNKRIIGILYDTRGNIRDDQNRHKEALMYYDSAIFYLSRLNVSDTFIDLSKLETEQYKRPYLMAALTDAALSRTKLLEQNDNEQKPYISATYQAIIRLTEMIRRDYLSEDAKLNLSADVKPILEKAFAFSRSASNGAEQAFMISEQSKSMTLLEAVRLNNRDFSNRGNAKALEETQNRLANLKKERIEIEKKRVNVSPNSAESRQLNTDLTQNIADERSERLKFNTAIGATMANDTLVSVANIQNKLLDSDQALLEYFMQGDSILNIFCLTQNDPILLKTIHLPKDFAAMLTSVSAAATPDGMRQKGVCDNAYKLYQLLIETVANEKKLPNRLIIVAEYPLSNLPFDVLLTQPATDYNKAVADGLPLIFKYALSYSYSANLLWEMRFLNKNNGQKGISAFAPAFPKKMNADKSYMNLALKNSFPYLTSLQNAQEIQSIGNDAQLFLNEKATKEAFKDACSHSNVLHIATHCIVNYTNPDFNYISFSQNNDTLNRNALFYLKDLYANPMPLDLAVFSACQSAIGKEIKGEAPLSMARGLAYAGVRSFITTQWFVNTDKNADFYKFFYAALAKGTPKDVALQEAKKQFINYAEGNSDPYFWASMMLIGNTEPIDFQGNRNDFWWAILGLTIVVSGFLYWRKRK